MRFLQSPTARPVLLLVAAAALVLFVLRPMRETTSPAAPAPAISVPAAHTPRGATTPGRDAPRRIGHDAGDRTRDALRDALSQLRVESR